MARRVELVADRRLLDASFEGYKLGGGDAKAIREPLEAGPGAPGAASDSKLHSFLHVRLHALHNALVRDPFTDACYYVDGSERIRRIKGGRPVDVTLSWQPTETSSATAGEHPPTLVFPTPDKAVYANGSGSLTVFSTGDRDRDIAWTVETVLRPINHHFSLLDAKMNASQELHCVLYRIEQDNTTELCVGFLEWIAFDQPEKEWSLTGHRTLKCAGPIHYCTFEMDCEALYVAADRPVEFVTPDPPQTEAVSEPKEKKYTWTQTGDDVTLTIKLTPEMSSFAPSVDVTGNRLVLSCNGAELLEGEMSLPVEDLTTWNVDNSGNLTVTFVKRDSGKIWKSFLRDGDDEGEQVMDPGLVAEVHERLAHLCSENEVTGTEDAPLFNSQQLEECDFTSQEDSCLVRLHGASLKCTHKAFLSSHQIILNVQSSPSECLAIGLRYDTDTCIWQPRRSDNGEWTIKHEGTLNAFGYVQSSKQQKKYTVCSPDLEYCVVCEPNRHAFVYRQNRKNCHLRQRSGTGDTRRVKIGRQQMISFERDDEIMGICATDDFLYFLTGNSVIVVDMRE